MTLRRAMRIDMLACARVHRIALNAALPRLTGLHTPDEDQAFFSGPVFDTCEVWVAGDPVRGFIAFRAGWIDQLYVDPFSQGRGTGSVLLTKALERGVERRLWTSQCNATARRFYERHGFVAERFTDGIRNEEREPDVLYVRTASTL